MGAWRRKQWLNSKGSTRRLWPWEVARMWSLGPSSIVTDAETWGLLRSRARTIWLKASPDEHWNRVVAQGDVRPMRGRPEARSELGRLLASRSPLYQQADLVIDTSKKSAPIVVSSVLSALA